MGTSGAYRKVISGIKKAGRSATHARANAHRSDGAAMMTLERLQQHVSDEVHAMPTFFKHITNNGDIQSPVDSPSLLSDRHARLCLRSSLRYSNDEIPRIGAPAAECRDFDSHYVPSIQATRCYDNSGELVREALFFAAAAIRLYFVSADNQNSLKRFPVPRPKFFVPF
jgi:hypothetical protein